MEIVELKTKIESLLFISHKPITISEASKVIEKPRSKELQRKKKLKKR